jgi:ubiquinone/menaquinone biosynthesis C-methylase UbiE
MNRSERSILAEYSKLAPVYDRRWSRYIEATIGNTLRRLPLAGHERIIDVGCGTGVLLERLAEAHPTGLLAGVEPVKAMRDRARSRLPPELELREGWVEALPYPDSEFDVVVSCNMFHYVRQPEQALAEMRRVLRPNGRLVLTDWCDDYWLCRICDRWLRLFSRAYFRSYGSRRCAQMLAGEAFTHISVDRYKISLLWGLMTAAAVK